jgi:cutinase
MTNVLSPGGADPEGVAEAIKDYELAAANCPNTILTGGGYSQGAAVTRLAIQGLPENVKSRVAGIVLVGDTRFYQEKGQIKGFPADKVHTWCNGYGELKAGSADGVCNG